MEHLNVILPLAIGICVVILQIWSLINLRDKYVKKEDCVKKEHKSFMSRSEIKDLCKICKPATNTEVLISEINKIKKILYNNDIKFTFIRLLQLEMINEMDLKISKSRIKDLEEIAKNSRTDD